MRHMPNRILTTAEVADRLEVSKSTVLRLVRKRRLLPERELGRNGLLFDEAVVRQYQMSVPPADEDAAALSA